MNDFDPIKRPNLWVALCHGLGSIACDVLFALAIVVTMVCTFYALGYMIVNYPVPLVATTLGTIVVFTIAWRALSWYELEEQRLYDEQTKDENSDTELARAQAQRVQERDVDENFIRLLMATQHITHEQAVAGIKNGTYKWGLQ